MTTAGLDASAKLSNFDVSQENNKRAIQHTVAFSLNFAAPELLLLPKQQQQKVT